MNICIDVVVKGLTLSVDFTARISHIGNDGIGHYEYWGAKCFDKGHDYVEEFEVSDVCVHSYRLNKSVTPSPALVKVIEDMLYDNHSDYIIERLTDDMPSKDDYMDEDDDFDRMQEEKMYPEYEPDYD